MQKMVKKSLTPTATYPIALQMIRHTLPPSLFHQEKCNGLYDDLVTVRTLQKNNTQHFKSLT